MLKKKNFFLNGQMYYSSQNLNLLDLIIYFNYNETLLILEHNNLLCERKNWRNQILQTLVEKANSIKKKKSLEKVANNINESN